MLLSVLEDRHRVVFKGKCLVSLESFLVYRVKSADTVVLLCGDTQCHINHVEFLNSLND